jgi:hypothetical protein
MGILGTVEAEGIWGIAGGRTRSMEKGKVEKSLSDKSIQESELDNLHEGFHT